VSESEPSYQDGVDSALYIINSTLHAVERGIAYRQFESMCDLHDGLDHTNTLVISEDAFDLPAHWKLEVVKATTELLGLTATEVVGVGFFVTAQDNEVK